jgi:arabinosaccharide transport system substrate-binding protein
MRNYLPNMAGKFKVMPLPAWTKGGRRTSVLGGTMLGITKACRDPDAAWAFAKQLYFAPETARHLYATYRIVSPIKANWSLPCYDESDEFFSHQPLGRLYLNLAAEVPERISSPYYSSAGSIFGDAVVAVCRHVEQNGLTDPAAVEPEARRQLDKAQRKILHLMRHNVFQARHAP